MAPDPDLAELLRRAAVEPGEPFDRADVARRARRLRRNRRLAGAATTVAAAAPLLLIGQLLVPPDVHVRFGSGSLVTIERVATVSPTPTPTPTPSEVPGAIATTPADDGEATSRAEDARATPVPGAPAGSASPTPTQSSHATVVIKDPPGTPEQRPDLPGDRRHPDVVLSLVLERTEADQGESWQGWLEARNTGDEPVELGDARCWATWGLYRDDVWVGGQAGSTCDESHPGATLEPGGSLRLPLAFDTVAGDDRADRADPGGGDPAGGAPGSGDPAAQDEALEPGRYAAAAGLRVHTDAHDFPGVWYAPSVEVRINPTP